MAEWIVAIIALMGILANAITLHNDVRHLKDDIKEIKAKIESINEYLLKHK